LLITAWGDCQAASFVQVRASLRSPFLRARAEHTRASICCLRGRGLTKGTLRANALVNPDTNPCDRALPTAQNRLTVEDCSHSSRANCRAGRASWVAPDPVLPLRARHHRRGSVLRRKDSDEPRRCGCAYLRLYPPPLLPLRSLSCAMFTLSGRPSSVLPSCDNAVSAACWVAKVMKANPLD